MQIHNLSFLKDLSKLSDSVVIIGKGKNADKYIFNKEKIIILTINDSVFNYKNFSHCTCIVEGHLNKNLPLVMNNLEHAIIIRKNQVNENNLVIGCTPSLVISYLIQYTDFKNIYLQGFSMDGEIIMNDPFIEEKIKKIFIESVMQYNQDQDINKAYHHFKYYTAEFIGQINHYPYDWSRQIVAFEECFKISDKFNKKLVFITNCTRKSNYFKFEEIDKQFLI
jgi:hypothetical protein